MYAQSKKAFEAAGLKAFANEDYGVALNHFLSALEYNESDAANLYYAGECNRRLFEYQTALAWFTKAHQQSASDSILYRMAEIKLALGDVDGAGKILAETKQPSAGQMQYLQLRIDSVRSLLSKPVSHLISDAGKTVNSAFSDFAAWPVNDSTLLFSSLRFESGQGKEYISRILEAKMDSVEIYRFRELTPSINNISWHNCNASVTPDRKLMVFSRCNYNDNGKLICNLYESVNKEGNWQTPVKLNTQINKAPFTSTQPCITTEGLSGYRLYFVSDRTGGYGNTDIYTSVRDANGRYSNPVNCGTRINTTGREVTPFYNVLTGMLFFSSDSLHGLGGFDIYKVSMHDSSALPVNAGLPFNSGYNDLYFTQLLTNEQSGFFSSNRPGSRELNGSVCCYDIYRYHEGAEKVEPITRETTLPVVTDAGIGKTMDVVTEMKLHLPLKLYFDNDYPDPKSRKKTTKSDYETLYRDYNTRLEEYIKEYKGGAEEDAARDSVEKFFIAELQFNFSRLSRFSDLLTETLEDSAVITLSVRGFASPLAETGYNLILSSRRINSLLNYWQIRDDGILMKYIKEGKLIIREEPAGERPDSDVSDSVSDISSSVYSPSAARERRIEVIDIDVQR